MYPVKLVGPRVTLREFHSDDVDAALALVGDDRVTRWLAFDSRTREQAAAMIEGVIERAQQDPRTEYYLAVTLSDDSVIGFTRLGLDGVQAAKLGYATAAPRWGKGYALDASLLLVNFGFRELNLHRISAAIGPDNTRSIAVAQRLGMSYEGRIRDHVFTNGAWRDSLLYSVLVNEWPSAAPHSVAAFYEAYSRPDTSLSRPPSRQGRAAAAPTQGNEPLGPFRGTARRRGSARFPRLTG